METTPLSLGIDLLKLNVCIFHFYLPYWKYRTLSDIPAGDINIIINRLSSKPYITREVIHGAGDAAKPEEYLGNGEVQEQRR